MGRLHLIQIQTFSLELLTLLLRIFRLEQLV